MLADERRAQLVELVRQQGFASLHELALRLAVSESTVRRDLLQLEEEGTAQRTHGGALYTGPSPQLPHFDRRQAVEWDAKKAIAQAAAGLIGDTDTVLLDGGSTTYELAQLLVGRPLHVVTNSLPVANLFVAAPVADVIVVGGYVHAGGGTIEGTYAVRMLESLNVRKAVLSVAGVNERGLFNSNLQRVETERAMIACAEEVIIVADHTKLGHQSLAHVCSLDAIDMMVVDSGASEEWRRQIRAAGVDLVVAPVSANREVGANNATEEPA